MWPIYLCAFTVQQCDSISAWGVGVLDGLSFLFQVRELLVPIITAMRY
jgi:hypothetical protein